jgi:protein gp37
MNKTGISYLTHTWNPIVMRCEPPDPDQPDGCENCWHRTVADRHAINPTLGPERRAVAAGDAPPTLLVDELAAPLRRKTPSVIGAQFMGDLFHKDVPADWSRMAIAIASMARWHTFIFLTKRMQRARDFLTGDLGMDGLYVAHSMVMDEYGHHVFNVHARRRDDGRATAWDFERGMPPNVIIGTSAGTQRRLDERLPDLLAISGRRWLSLEPLLGPVDIRRALRNYCQCPQGGEPSPCDGWMDTGVCRLAGPSPKIDWVVVGPETGGHRRPCDIEWIRSVVQQCRAAEVPVFVKAVEIDGRVTSKLEDFPEDLRVREMPW